MNIDTDMNRLKNATYPGRGIVIGQTPDGTCMVQIYWIMGRSPSSRNRVFVREGDAVKTDTVDKSQDVDPLTLYYPIKVLGDAHIVTNGDQTDTIVHTLQNGGSFESALKTRTYEPDAPNFTPRISGLTDLSAPQAYRLSVLKTVGGDARYCSRQFFDYETRDPRHGPLHHNIYRRRQSPALIQRRAVCRRIIRRHTANRRCILEPVRRRQPRLATRKIHPFRNL